jgi:hypothetical protein
MQDALYINIVSGHGMGPDSMASSLGKKESRHYMRRGNMQPMR